MHSFDCAVTNVFSTFLTLHLIFLLAKGHRHQWQVVPMVSKIRSPNVLNSELHTLLPHKNVLCLLVAFKETFGKIYVDPNLIYLVARTYLEYYFLISYLISNIVDGLLSKRKNSLCILHIYEYDVTYPLLSRHKIFTL